jgi:hypothetical protein
MSDPHEDVERENERLRKEVRVLREEGEILKNRSGCSPPVRVRNSLCYHRAMKGRGRSLMGCLGAIGRQGAVMNTVALAPFPNCLFGCAKTLNQNPCGLVARLDTSPYLSRCCRLSYQDGSAFSVLPDVTQTRSCHQKCKAARVYVIVRDGAGSDNPNW